MARWYLLQQSLLLLLVLLVFTAIDRTVAQQDDDYDDDECGDLNKVVAFYEMEILIGSKATFCTLSERQDIGMVLKDLLDASFDHVPNLERATANLCSTPDRHGEEERNLMTEKIENENQIINVYNNDENDNQTLSSSMKLLFPLTPADDANDGDDEDEEEPDEENDFSQLVWTIDNNGILMTTGTPQADGEQVQRILVGQFVYRGGLRCTFCIPDDADARRQLANEECRQRRKNIFHGFEDVSSWQSWKNGNTFQYKGIQGLLGPYSNGDNVWRVFSVPQWTKLVSIRFQIYHMGDPWVACQGDSVILDLNGDRTVLRPPECGDYEGEEVMKMRGNNYTVAYKPSLARGGNILGTKVIINSYKRLFEETGDFEFRLIVKTSNPNKRAAFGNMIIRVEDTCTTVQPNHIKEDENMHNSTTSGFEDRMEEILSKRISRKFRRHVKRASNHHCLYRSNPTVYVNLYRKDTWEEAQPDCAE